MTSHINIERLQLIPDGGGEPIIYDADLGGHDLLAAEHRISLENVGTVAVRLSVDGDHTQVLADLNSGRDVSVLTRAIETLTAVRDELARLTEGHSGPRRCLTFGDFGRCQIAEHDQDHPHDFPSEQQWEVDRAVLAQVRERVAARRTLSA